MTTISNCFQEDQEIKIAPLYFLIVVNNKYIKYLQKLSNVVFLSADSFSFALQGGLQEMKMMKMKMRTVLYGWQ